MPRIVHLGAGNFFRALPAAYTQAAGGDWRITGVSFRSAAVRDALAPQGFDYSLVVRSAEGERIDRIGIIDSILVAPEDPGAVLSAIADPETAIVTITATEKAYALAPSGGLDLAHPDIVADLAGGPPGSLIGTLARGLAGRDAPVTVISCDNLPDNGPRLARAVADFARAAGLTLPPGLAFPATMVDRITPRTTDALRDHVAAATGFADRAPVETEAFSEWVIEDAFAGPRPDWEAAGAQIVADVVPHERRKLRMLNGAHSALAYLGTLAGHRSVHQAVADPGLRRVVGGLMDDAARTLGGLDPAAAGAYRDALLARFANPALDHRLMQIAQDGSQKLPIRLLAPAQDLMGRGQEAAAHAEAVAGWVAFVIRQAQAGIPLDDPMHAALAEAAQASGDPATALLALIYDAPLPAHFVESVSARAAALGAQARGSDAQGSQLS